MRTGSHIQARYAGNRQEEYRWFAMSASFPGTATDAAAAAKKIVRAAILGSAEVAIGLQAIAAARLSNIAPEVTAGLLSVANSFLPSAPATATPGDAFWEPDRSMPGKDYRGSLPRLLEHTGTAAIERYNHQLDHNRMNAADFRRVALACKDAEEGSHMGAADFRVGGRIFATLAHQAQGYGNLMLSPEQQAAFIQDQPEMFLPVVRRLGQEWHDPRCARKRH